jgi:hypothetical protein
MANTRTIELEPAQVELALACFDFVRQRLNEDHATGAHKFVAGPYTYKRIAELITIVKGAG